MTTKNSSYRPDIDGLRALAVTAVVLYHAFPELLPGGFIGVDIFFVISGFLITKIIAKSHDDKTFKYSEFYLRRIRRIFPALYLTLLATAGIAFFVFLPDELELLGKHLLGAIFFVSNFVLRKEVGYFDASSDFKPLLHLWSLAIEEQYYIFFPLVLITVLRRRVKPLPVLLFITISSFVLNLVTINRHPSSVFYLPATRIWEIMAGGVLAYLPPMKWDDKPAVRNLLSFLAFIAFGCAIVFVDRKVAFPGWVALIPVASGVLFILAGRDAAINRTLFSSRFITFLGRISYPLYLWHWPLLSFLFITQLDSPSTSQRLIAVFAALLLASLTYRFIELPGKRASNRRILSVLSFFAGVCIFTAGFYIYGQGLTWRYDLLGKTHIKSQLKQLSWGEELISSQECQKKFLPAQFCNIGNIKEPPTAALVGDSHANHFFPGFSEHYRSKGGNLINLGRGGCPPFYKMDGTAQAGVDYNCTDSFDAIFDFVIRTPSIRTVLLAFHHNAYGAPDVRYRDKLGEIASKDNKTNERLAFLRTVRRLESSGKKVVLIYDLPDLKFQNTRNLINLRPVEFHSKPLGDTREFFINHFQDYDEMVGEIRKATQLNVFFTHPLLEGNFPIDQNGNLSYRDYTHLSINGSRIIGSHFDLD